MKNYPILPEVGHHKPSETKKYQRSLLKKYHLAIQQAMAPLATLASQKIWTTRPTLHHDVANLHRCHTSKNGTSVGGTLFVDTLFGMIYPKDGWYNWGWFFMRNQQVASHAHGNGQTLTWRKNTANYSWNCWMIRSVHWEQKLQSISVNAIPQFTFLHPKMNRFKKIQYSTQGPVLGEP